MDTSNGGEQPQTLEQPQWVHAAGYLIFRRRSDNRQAPLEFLLMRHPKRWDLPKGHQDPGETIEQTADRELMEETGIPPAAVWRDPHFRCVSEYPVSYKKFPGQVFQKRLTIFLGLLNQNVDVATTEHSGFQWYPWAPPHSIQAQAIDPLLEKVAEYFSLNPSWPEIPSSPD